MERYKKCPFGAATPSGADEKNLHNQFSIQIPEEQEKMQKIMELFWLAVSINGLKDRKKEKTGDLPTVFVGFNGHVSVLEFTVYPTGWGSHENRNGKELCVDYDLEMFNKNYDDIKRWLLEAKEAAG